MFFCRQLYYDTLREVRSRFGSVILKHAGLTEYILSDYCFEIAKCPEAPQGFSVDVQAGNRWEARAEGWRKFLEQEQSS